MKINVVCKHVIKPSSPTPSHLREYKLSFIDEIIPHSYFHVIMYYSIPQKNISQNIKHHQEEISQVLRNSLSETLTDFYPLAGRIKGQTSIDCNDEGVRYLEALVVDDYRLSDLIERPDASVLDELIPCKSSGNVSPDTEELLVVQVSFFRCGGIGLGICQSHRIGDGFSLCTFIKAWADRNLGKYCCGGTGMRIQRRISPVFDSAKIFPPRNTPDFRPNPKAPTLQPSSEKIGTKRFVFDSRTLDLLKQKVMNHSPNTNPSRVNIVSALIWKSWMVAIGMNRESGTSIAFQVVNLRGRMIPSLTEYSFGNIFQMAKAVTTDGGEENWMDLVEKLKEGVREIDCEYAEKLLGENGSEICKKNFNELSGAQCREGVQALRYSSWCGFELYGIDFGWGNAVWVSSASFMSKNQVFLLDSAGGSGNGIEAWMNMSDNEMAKFEQDLLMELQCCSSFTIN